jgi:hypothetical protein
MLTDDAVTNAIAKRFPDGFDLDQDDDMADNWPDILAREIGIEEEDGSHQEPILEVVNKLMGAGRLREMWPDYGCATIIALSWSEHACRVLRAMGTQDADDGLVEALADVLAGKVMP